MTKKQGYLIAEITALLCQGYEDINNKNVDKEEIAALNKVVSASLSNLKKLFRVHLQHDKLLGDLQRLDSEVEELTKANASLAEERDNERERGDINYDNLCRREEEVKELHIKYCELNDLYNTVSDQLLKTKESSATMLEKLNEATNRETKALNRVSEVEANLEKAIQGNENLYQACKTKEEQVDKLITLAISLGGNK